MTRRPLLRFALTFVTAMLVVHQAFACGGGFGAQVQIKPQQTIALSHRDGIESYIFQPHFCGVASEFGLILPVPAPLSSNPALTGAALYSELESIAAPRIETVDVCTDGGLLMGGASKSATDGAGAPDNVQNDGVNVVAAGNVGVFSWELLRADTAKSLTDWLDAREFPYPEAARTIFQHYVDARWYFVAFQVNAGNAPRSGYRLCGDFGPISLSFPTAQPIIPARIAVAGVTPSSFTWRVFNIAAAQLTLVQRNLTAHQVRQFLRYSGELDATTLAQHPAVAAIARTGAWLTELDFTFYADSLTDDIELAPAASNVPFRQVIIREREVDCGVFGCAMSTVRGAPRWFLHALVALGALLVVVVRAMRPRTARRP
jgi:hypothetical protein